MPNLTKKQESRNYYAYECRTGCGHITLTDKLYKNKRTHCAVCGEKTEMEYRGEHTITSVPDPRFINLGLSKPD